jgi:hypothetical protein
LGIDVRSLNIDFRSSCIDFQSPNIDFRSPCIDVRSLKIDARSPSGGAGPGGIGPGLARRRIFPDRDGHGRGAPDTLDFWVANADSRNVASHTRFTHYNLGELLKAPPAR